MFLMMKFIWIESFLFSIESVAGKLLKRLSLNFWALQVRDKYELNDQSINIGNLDYNNEVEIEVVYSY